MTNIKKLALSAAALCLLLCLSGCGGGGERVLATVDIVSRAVDDMKNLSETPAPAVTPTFTPDPTPEATPVPTATPLPTAEPTPDPTAAPLPTPRSDVFLTGSGQAEYLRLSPCTNTASDEKQRLFTATVMSGLSGSFDLTQDIAGLFEAVVYGESANVGFLLSVADACGLTDLGMFDVFPDCHMQYRYMLDVNGFGSCLLTDCIPFGGSLSATPGDIIFWLDENGKAVNFGLVTAAETNYLRVVLCRADGSRASFDVNWANLGQRCSSAAVLLHPVYPSVEQMVFYFCTEELRYTPAVACGIMANLYVESSFVHDVDRGAYGLCQWTGERRYRLESWCAQNGLSHRDVYGQLCYMAYELSLEKYITLDAYLRSLGNTPEDAGSAAREFCFKYESPGDLSNTAYDRALFAAETLFPIYSQYTIG